MGMAAEIVEEWVRGEGGRGAGKGRVHGSVCVCVCVCVGVHSNTHTHTHTHRSFLFSAAYLHTTFPHSPGPIPFVCSPTIPQVLHTRLDRIPTLSELKRTNSIPKQMSLHSGGLTNRLWSCKSSERNPLLNCLNLSLGLHAAETEGSGVGGEEGEVGRGEEGEGGEGRRGFWSMPANCAMRPAAALILSRGPLPARTRPWEHCSRCLENELELVNTLSLFLRVLHVHQSRWHPLLANSRLSQVPHTRAHTTTHTHKCARKHTL
jgi:hypothetical protein